MNAKDIEGRRVVKIEQGRKANRNTGKPLYYVERLLLDNGTRIIFSVHEGEGEYFITATAYKRDDVTANDE